MIKNNSLKVQLLFTILITISVAMSTIFFISYSHLKDKVDIEQENLYNEKINNIIYLIDQKYQKLQKTGLVEAYEDSFKAGTIDTIKEVFYNRNKDIYPFIVDENNFLILHRTFNKENSIKYQDNNNFKKLVSQKNGNFDLTDNNGDRWVIFKHYESWNWIIGYRVHQDIKYKELNEFRNNFIFTLILVLFFTSIIIILIVKSVLKPILSLTEISKKITSGKLDTKIDIDGAIELKDLASNFNIMRNKIVKDIDKLKENDEKINKFNKNLQKEVNERTKELLEQKETFETLFNDSSDGLSLLKGEKFIDCNKALLDMLGCKTKEEFLSLTPYDVSPTKQPDGQSSEKKSKEVIKKCLDEGSVNFEWVHLKANKKSFWVEILLTKIIINHEVVIYAVWRDIQDKKELELQLHNRSLDLQESNDELEVMVENLKETQNKLIESEKLAGLGSLVAGVAHEINTPVGIGLTGSSHFEYLNEEINEKYKNKEMTEEDFEGYLESSSSLAKLINSNLLRTAEIIKNFKQVAVDQTSEQKRSFRVKEYIKGILISIDSITKQKEIDFKIDCNDDLEITSYPGLFAQIITNLVSNSIIHGYDNKKEGVVSFKIKETNRILYLEYCDDGKGIPQKNLIKIYEPFFTTNRKRGGSGLGLNIVYNLVTINLKGTIECISEEGVGTTFKISIPI